MLRKFRDLENENSDSDGFKDKKHLKNVGPIRHCEPPHADVHNHNNNNNDDDNDNAWQRGPLWPHRMGPKLALLRAANLFSVNRNRKDERLSWPVWLTSSGWFTHYSGHPSAAGRAQGRKFAGQWPTFYHCATQPTQVTSRESTNSRQWRIDKGCERSATRHRETTLRMHSVVF